MLGSLQHSSSTCCAGAVAGKAGKQTTAWRSSGLSGDSHALQTGEAKHVSPGFLSAHEREGEGGIAAVSTCQAAGSTAVAVQCRPLPAAGLRSSMDAHTQQAAWWHYSHVVEADEAQRVPGKPCASHADAVQREADDKEADGHLNTSHNEQRLTALQHNASGRHKTCKRSGLMWILGSICIRVCNVTNHHGNSVRHLYVRQAAKFTRRGHSRKCRR